MIHTGPALVAEDTSILQADRKSQTRSVVRRTSDRRPDAFFQRRSSGVVVVVGEMLRVSSEHSLVPLWRRITEKAQHNLPFALFPSFNYSGEYAPSPPYIIMVFRRLSRLFIGGLRDACQISARRQGGNGVSERHRAFPAIQKDVGEGEAKDPEYEQVPTGLPVICALPTISLCRPSTSISRAGSRTRGHVATSPSQEGPKGRV